MKDWIENLPADQMLEEYAKLKEELIECFREELRVLRDNPILPRGRRAEFYNAQKEVVLKLLLLAGGTETTQVATDCWLLAKKDVPTHHAIYPSFRLPSQR